MPPRSIISLVKSKNRNSTQIGKKLENLEQSVQAIQQQIGQQQPGQLSIHQQLQAIQQQLGQQQPGQPPIHQQLQTIQNQLQKIQQQLGQQQQGQVHQAPLTKNDFRVMINSGFAKNDFDSNFYPELYSYEYIKNHFEGFRFAQIRLFFDGLVADLNQQQHLQIPSSSRNDRRSFKSYLRYLESIWSQIQNHLIHPPQLITNIYQNNYDNAKDDLIV